MPDIKFSNRTQLFH